jgi:hypothetical protein
MFLSPGQPDDLGWLAAFGIAALAVVVIAALMTFALHWVGQPVGPALAAVVVYRVFNFLVPLGLTR